MPGYDDFSDGQKAVAHGLTLDALMFCNAMFQERAADARAVFDHRAAQPHGACLFASALGGVVIELAYRLAGSPDGVSQILDALLDAEHLKASTFEGITQLGAGNQGGVGQIDTPDTKEG